MLGSERNPTIATFVKPASLSFFAMELARATAAMPQPSGDTETAALRLTARSCDRKDGSAEQGVLRVFTAHDRPSAFTVTDTGTASDPRACAPIATSSAARALWMRVLKLSAP